MKNAIDWTQPVTVEFSGELRPVQTVTIAEIEGCSIRIIKFNVPDGHEIIAFASPTSDRAYLDPINRQCYYTLSNSRDEASVFINHYGGDVFEVFDCTKEADDQNIFKKREYLLKVEMRRTGPGTWSSTVTEL